MEAVNNPNIALAKKLNVAAWIITIVVLALVGMMRRVKIDTGIDFSFLPPFHATLNAITAVILVFALIQTTCSVTCIICASVKSPLPRNHCRKPCSFSYHFLVIAFNMHRQSRGYQTHPPPNELILYTSLKHHFSPFIEILVMYSVR